jgi:hypothetical protein
VTKAFSQISTCFLGKRAFNCSFEISFGWAFGDVENTYFACNFKTKFEGYFVDIGEEIYAK